jgi:hypothetical protein
MKKIKPRLQLTTNTVRVLQDAELSAVRGGNAPLVPAGRSSNDPTACFVSGN